LERWPILAEWNYSKTLRSSIDALPVTRKIMQP